MRKSPTRAAFAMRPPRTSFSVANAAAHATGFPPNVFECAPDGQSITCSLATVRPIGSPDAMRSEEHTSELQSQSNLVCRLLLEKKNRRECIKETRRVVDIDGAVAGHVSTIAIIRR